MKFWACAYGLLIAALLLLVREWGALPDGRLHVTLLDVGQGDAILLTTPGRQHILIDGGPDLTILERLGEELPFFLHHLDLVILSHTDADHVTGFPEILRRYDVDRVMLTGVARDTSVYQGFLDAVREEGAEVIFADSMIDLDLGEGVVLDVLSPEKSLFGQEVTEPNNASIVAKLLYKDHEVLLTGDIEEKVERALLARGLDLRSDILKVPHHGSKTSSSELFLEAVHPDLALISVGRDNHYGHPNPAVLARYKSLGIPVRRTDLEGNVEVVFE